MRRPNSKEPSALTDQLQPSTGPKIMKKKKIQFHISPYSLTSPCNCSSSARSRGRQSLLYCPAAAPLPITLVLPWVNLSPLALPVPTQLGCPTVPVCLQPKGIQGAHVAAASLKCAVIPSTNINCAPTAWHQKYGDKYDRH